MHKIILIGIALVFLTCRLAMAETYLNDTFNDYADIAAVSAAGWGVQAEASLESTGCNTSKCIKLTYDGSWTQFTWQLGGGYPEGYLGFYAKLVNKQAAWVKFLKFFGAPGGSAYANWTSGAASYTSVTLRQINFSDSLGPTGDGECRFRWTDGTVNTVDGCVGTVDTYSGSDFTFPDENWHHFVFYWKLNTDGNSDGAFGVWIDDVQVAGASSVVNRADTNTRGFSYFSLGDYTSATGVPAWSLWYDDVIFASTYAEAAATGGDATPPTVTGFVIPATSSSLTVPISTFTATDDTGVASYCVVEVDNSAGCSWSGTAQTSYVFATQGAKTLYAFARDAALNVSSSANDSVTITIAQVSPGITSSSIGKGLVGSSIGKGWTVGP